MIKCTEKDCSGELCCDDCDCRPYIQDTFEQLNNDELTDLLSDIATECSKRGIALLYGYKSKNTIGTGGNRHKSEFDAAMTKASNILVENMMDRAEWKDTPKKEG